MLYTSPDVDVLWPTWFHFRFLWWGFVSLLAYPVRTLLTDLSRMSWITGRGQVWGGRGGCVEWIGHCINWVHLTNCRWLHASFMGMTQYFYQLEDSVWTIYMKMYREIALTGGLSGDAGATIYLCMNVSWKTTILGFFFSLLSAHYLGFMSNLWCISLITATVNSFMQPN